MKRFHNWQLSGKPINEFMRPGDEIDGNFARHFVDRLCGTIFDGGIVQVIMPGEDRSGLFPTIKRTGDKWFYCGDCRYGETA